MRYFLATLFSLITFFSFSQDTTNFHQLDSIMVISVRGDNKTPITQKIIKRQDIQKTYQGEEVPFMLNNYPSITSQSDGGQPQGYTYFRLRGIDQTRINMTLDGVPLNEPEDQGVYTSNYPGFTNVIQSMQIQRGVGTSSNGVASFAGSINFESRNGFEKGTEVDFGYGSFNTKRFNLSNSTGLRKKFALFSNLSMYSSDGYKYRSGGYGFSGFISGGYYGGNNIVKIIAFEGNSSSQMAWSPVSENDIKIDPRTNYNYLDAPDNFNQAFIQIQYIKILNSTSKISTTAFYNRLDGAYDYFETGYRSVFLKSNFTGVISNYQYKKNNFKLNLGVNVSTYNRDHLNIEDHNTNVSYQPGYGGSPGFFSDYLSPYNLSNPYNKISTIPGSINDITNNGNIYVNQASPRYENNGIKNQVSEFVKINYDINKFTLFADFQYRFSTFKYQGLYSLDSIPVFLKWGFLNPRLGVIFNKSNKLNFYFSIGKTSREPSRTDMFSGNDNLNLSIGNAISIINPEQVIDYELGINFKRSDIKLQANLYYMNFKNEIVLLGALGPNSLPLTTSVKSSFRSGLEFDLFYKPTFSPLSFTTNFNYSYNKISTDNFKINPILTPNFILNQSIDFNYNWIYMSINFKYNSVSYLSFDNSYYTPSFGTLGFNIGIIKKKYSILFKSNNLCDKKFYTSGYVVGSSKYYFVNPLSTFYTTFKINL